MHGCDAINPHSIDHFKRKKNGQTGPHWSNINFTVCCPSIVLGFLFSFLFWAVSSCSEGVWPLKSCKKLCTEMCVAVYYLNVSGLQSDRHSYNKENMFWTACFCRWLQCVDNFFFFKKSLINVICGRGVEPHPPDRCVKTIVLLKSCRPFNYFLNFKKYFPIQQFYALYVTSDATDYAACYNMFSRRL